MCPAAPPSPHSALCPHSDALGLHLKTHKEVNTHSCSVCGKKFTRQVDLKYHVLTHTGPRPSKCGIYERRFRWPSQVTARRRGLQIRIRKTLTCPVCKQTFINRAHLAAHSRTHPEESGVCGVQRAKLHERSNAKERPLSCTVCGKRFSWKYQAKRHTCAGVWVTEDPPPSWTGATYRRKKIVVDSDGGQNRQQRDTNSCHGNTGTEGKQHSNRSRAQKPPDVKSEPQTEEPRDCSLCGKRLTSESPGHRCACEGPPDHQNQSGHAGKELLSCSICNAAFWDRDSLVLHMRSHTKLTRFTCPVCTKDFVWRRHLTKHMEVHQNHRGAPVQNKQVDSSDCDTDDSDFWSESRDIASSRRLHSRSLLNVHSAAHHEHKSQRKQGEVKEEPEEAQIFTFELLAVKTEEEEKPPCGLSGDPREASLQPESDDSVDSDFWKDDRKRPSALN